MAGTTLIDDALTSARAAAARAEVRVQLLSSAREAVAVEALLQRVWSMDAAEPLVTAPLLRALGQEGGYVAGAFQDDELVGASVGFLGKHDGAIHLHSHISGVSARLQGASIGFALKQHQRWWALDQGLGSVTWTFDPLVRKNAYFNLSKLGADIIAFEPDFYGPMSDGINKLDETDRCVVVWDLGSPRAIAGAAGLLDEPEGTPDAAVIVEEGPRGEPRVSDQRSEVLAAWVPADIVALRARDADLALRWRRALRETFGAALGEGYAATSMSRSGWYLLQRRP